MKSVLVTGAKGFIGKNLCSVLRERDDVCLFEYDIDTPSDVMISAVKESDIVYHLAGVNRPKDPSDFETGNLGSIEELVHIAGSLDRKPTIVLTSSIQAGLDNPYGISKLHAERALSEYEEKSGAVVYIFRLANAFGKWCRPFYNSVVATFCHQAAHHEPLRIDDPAKVIEFVYIDDIVGALVGILDGIEPSRKDGYCTVAPIHQKSLGALAEMLSRFSESRKTCRLPALSDPFEKKLYSTYLSYLDPDDFAYSTKKKADQRGYLFELIKSADAGQVFVSRTLPGIKRGNHYHHTKVEKFCVVEGAARIALRHMATGEHASYDVDGRECRVVDIPPGWTHSIENIGDSDLLTIFWANEIFSPERPDTFFAEVEDGEN